MTILWNNDGWAALEEQILNLQTEIQNLSSQLGQQNNSTLEGIQSTNALNDRINLYKKAIDEYSGILSSIRWTSAEARRGSAQKQQAKQWYITGLSTKRGMTHAEAMKDMADVEAAWRSERAEIRWKEQELLGSAKWWLSNMYMTMAEQQAAIDAANASSSSGGGSYSKWWSSDNVDALMAQLRAAWKTDEEINEILYGWKTGEVTQDQKKSALTKALKNLGIIAAGAVWYKVITKKYPALKVGNIFKTLFKKAI